MTITSAGQKDLRRPLLPAPIGACGNGDTPQTVRKGRLGRVSVVYERKGAVEALPVHAVRVVDGAEAQTVEGRGGGVQAGEATHPISEALVGRQGGRSGDGVPADYEIWMHRSGEGPSGGEGGGHRWRGGWARTTLECTFLLLFLWCDILILSSGREDVSYVFPYWWLGADYDRQGRSGATEKVICKQLLPAALWAAAEPLPWPFGPHVAG